jgi:hypothetical protein
VYAQEGEPAAGAPAEQAAPPGADASKESAVQNAVLEGIQLSSEKGEQPEEVIITCYFIFRDKPTSYFYEAKPKESQLVFEFNDCETGVSPIPSMQEKPIQGFRVEMKKVDVNAEVKGLTPEWHDVAQVTFFMDNIPEITVKDEYSVISFSFPWTTNPDKVKDYIVAAGGAQRMVMLIAIGGGVAIGAGVGVALYLLGGEDGVEGDEILSTDDLPVHPNPEPTP